jgi:hypothetical protein
MRCKITTQRFEGESGYPQRHSSFDVCVKALNLAIDAVHKFDSLNSEAFPFLSKRLAPQHYAKKPGEDFESAVEIKFAAIN